MFPNRKLGLILFGAYFVCYAAFVLVNAFAPSAMEHELLSGINLAIATGFGLIALALVLAALYGWLCRGNANRSSVDFGARTEAKERS